MYRAEGGHTHPERVFWISVEQLDPHGETGREYNPAESALDFWQCVLDFEIIGVVGPAYALNFTFKVPARVGG